MLYVCGVRHEVDSTTMSRTHYVCYVDPSDFVCSRINDLHDEHGEYKIKVTERKTTRYTFNDRLWGVVVLTSGSGSA